MKMRCHSSAGNSSGGSSDLSAGAKSPSCSVSSFTFLVCPVIWLSGAAGLFGSEGIGDFLFLEAMSVGMTASSVGCGWGLFALRVSPIPSSLSSAIEMSDAEWSEAPAGPDSDTLLSLEIALASPRIPSSPEVEPASVRFVLSLKIAASPRTAPPEAALSGVAASSITVGLLAETESSSLPPFGPDGLLSSSIVLTGWTWDAEKEGNDGEGYRQAAARGKTVREKVAPGQHL